jgi:hypothetical protein
MKKYIVILCLSTLSMSVFAAPSSYKQLTASAADKIKNIDIVLAVPQKEVGVTVSTAKGGMVFGLLGAIIDANVTNARANNAETAIIPIRDSLLNFKAEDSLQGAISHNITSIPWVADSTIKLTNTVTSAEYDKLLLDSKKSAVLFLKILYSLSTDFKQVRVFGYATLFPNTEELRKMQFDLYKDTSQINETEGVKTLIKNSLYNNVLIYSKTLDVDVVNIKDAAAAWAENDGKRVNAALSEGIESIATLLAIDLKKLSIQPSGEQNSDGKENFKITVLGQDLEAERTAKGTLMVKSKN